MSDYKDDNDDIRIHFYPYDYPYDEEEVLTGLNFFSYELPIRYNHNLEDLVQRFMESTFDNENNSDRTDRKLDLTREVYNSDEDNKCAICQTNYEKTDYVCRLSCDHIFHYDCMEEAGRYRAQCPLCRSNIPILSE